MFAFSTEQTMSWKTTIVMRGGMTLLVSLAIVNVEAASQTAPIRIGMAKSFLFEQPKSFVDIAADEFKEVLKKVTGLDGALDSKFGAFEVADKLQSKQLDFGVFHAHEFAWVQKKYPELQPLLIAVNKNHAERGYLIVHMNSTAKSLDGLRGKKLDVPVGNSEPSRLFLEKIVAERDPKGVTTFFASTAKSASTADALDDLARGKVDAVLVNATGLEFYKDVKGPVFAKNMRILQQSDPFPPAVIAHRKGLPAEATLTQFRDGLLKAHTIPLGREMMKTWNVDAFEGIPADYAMQISDVLKAYPAPKAEK